MHKKRAIVILFTILFLISMRLILELYHYKEDLFKIELHNNNIALLKGAKKIGELWQKGDAENQWENNNLNCSSFLGNYSIRKKRRTRCNHAFLKCYLTQKNITIKHHNKKYQIQTKSILTIAKSVTKNANDPSFGVTLLLSSDDFPEYVVPIVLEDSCNDIYLPKNIYGLNQYVGNEGSDNWQWDNFEQNIFIDKFLVTFYDVAVWAKMIGNIILTSKVQGKERSWLPITNLTKKEMRDYCSFRGKQLLTAKHFDAATFLPHKKKNSRVVYRPPYPFNHRKHGKLFLKNSAITKEECTLAYTKQCKKKFKLTDLPLTSYSWSGIFELFGGPLKYQENRVLPDENLFLSSSYLTKNSPWHQLGKRSLWSSQNKKKLKEILGQESLDIAFRCMKYGYNDND